MQAGNSIEWCWRDIVFYVVETRTQLALPSLFPPFPIFSRRSYNLITIDIHMYILMVIRTFPFHNTYLLLLLLLLFSSSAPKLIYMADAMSKKKTSIPVVLIGCGGVGQQLLHHILATRALHANSQVSSNNYTHSPSSSPIPTGCRPVISYLLLEGHGFSSPSEITSMILSQCQRESQTLNFS